MSSISSQELAASASGSNEPECEPSRSARSTPSVAECSPGAGQTCLSLQMSGISGEKMTITGNTLTSSAGDFPAKTSASQQLSMADILVSTEIKAVSGLSTIALSKKSGRSSRSSKTLTASPGTDLTAYCGRLPRSGMMRNGTLFQAPSLERHSLESASGLLPTLPASEWKDCSKASVLARLDRGGRVARRICSTSPGLRSSKEIVFLNPCFGEWMSGLPIGWTDCTLSETPSSHKSRKRSDEQS